MTLRISKSIVQALSVPAALIASPMAVVDTMDYSAGTIIEGQASIVKHTFKVTNTGDSVLVIQHVKPG